MKDTDTAGVLAPPPLIYGAAFGIGLLLDQLGGWSIPWPAGPMRWIAAAVPAALGIVLGVSAVLQFRRVGTNVLPDHPALFLADAGPYRFSRNPMYLGLALLYLAGAAALAKPATLLFLPVALTAIHVGVIRREERYLERRFGAPYRAYQARVRRWF